jgi:recombinational DNA repair protein (RecF pathway)
MEFLDAVLAFLTNLSPTVVAGAALVLELVLRLFPSEKPKSILHLVSSGIRKVSDVLEGVANLLDKVLPQKLLK